MGAGETPPGYNGWIDYTWYNADQTSLYDANTYVQAYWNVPLAPQTNGGLLYFFDSLQTSAWQNSPGAILQPVLSWGSNGLYGGNYWSMADWVYYTDGTSVIGEPITVNPGDQIFGFVKATGFVSWTIEWVDETSGQWWYVDLTDGNLLPMSNAQTGVLEMYNVETCSQLPNQHWLEFYDTLVGIAEIWPTFNLANQFYVNPPYLQSSSGTPACSYNIAQGTYFGNPNGYAYLEWNP